MKFSSMFILLLVCSFAIPLYADFLELHSTGDGIEALAGIEGRGRGIGFRADSTFSIDSAGVFFDLVEQSYDVLVYSSVTGSDAVEVLASSSLVVGGEGAAFYDIPIEFTFEEGSFYVLHWRPSDLGNSDWLAANTQDGYFFDDELPQTIGPVTLLDGVEGSEPTVFSNFLHPNLRVTVVPEPSGLAVLSIFGLFIRRVRKNN